MINLINPLVNDEGFFLFPYRGMLHGLPSKKITACLFRIRPYFFESIWDNSSKRLANNNKKRIIKKGSIVLAKAFLMLYKEMC